MLRTGTHNWYAQLRRRSTTAGINTWLVQVDGVIQCVANCAIILAKIETATDVAVEDAGEVLKRNMQQLAPIWTSALKDSITIRKGEDPNTIEVGPTVPYGLYMEYGSPPHTPPSGALAEWAADHGMAEATIVMKIQESGVYAQPFVGPAIEMSKPEIESKLLGMSAVISL